jgi:hypothetical protein
MNRVEVVERRGTPDGVIEAVDAPAEGLLGLGSGLEDGASEQFRFQSLEEGLDDRGIITVSSPSHRDLDAVFGPLRLIPNRTLLTAAIRVMGQPTRSADRHSLAQRLESQLLVQPGSYRPAYHCWAKRSRITAIYSQPSFVHR